MTRRSLPGWLGVVLAVLGSGPPLRGADVPGADDWQYDVVRLRDGDRLRGLVVEQDADHVLIHCVRRNPGRPTIVSPIRLDAGDVVKVDRLDDEHRTELRRRLTGLLRQRRMLMEQIKLLDPDARGTAPAEETVKLHKVPWVLPGRGEALGYQSAHFRLVSNAQPRIVRLAAIQLEQVYDAYARCLPARVTKAVPTTIILTRSLTDYRALARGPGRSLLNPAFYDPARNRIVCGNDFQALCEELRQTRRRHEKLTADLNAREKELARVYGGKGRIPRDLRQPLEEARKKIRTVEARNNAAFDQTRNRLFERLYHEAFHAYLANFVYPPRAESVPRWLNEGLAQIVETAIFEVGELRVGHADPRRLAAVRAALKRGTLLPVADLLRSGSKQFVIAHAGDRQLSDRSYLASWALAYYLTFERKLLRTRAFDDYIHALGRGTNPVEAFRTLVGQPLPQFEKQFRNYLEHLHADGTVGKGK